jgi:hypothetical protein
VPQLWTYEHTLAGGTSCGFVWVQDHTYAARMIALGALIATAVENPGPPWWDAITELSERGDAPSLKPNHTLFGHVQRRHEMEDYRQTNIPGPGQRLSRVWFGIGAFWRTVLIVHDVHVFRG